MTKSVFRQKMTDAEVDAWAWEQSTKEEKAAVLEYRDVQQTARENYGLWGETDMLRASQAVAVIVKRNKRLGLCK